MKQLFIMMAFFAVTVSSGFAQDSPSNGKLTIRIEGVRNNNGKIMVGVGDYRHPEQMCGTMVPADTAGVVCALEQLPTGTQKVYVYHDENGNFNLDKGDKGPTEGVGTDTKGAWDPEVSISATDQEIVLYMKYAEK